MKDVTDDFLLGFSWLERNKSQCFLHQDIVVNDDLKILLLHTPAHSVVRYINMHETCVAHNVRQVMLPSVDCFDAVKSVSVFGSECRATSIIGQDNNDLDTTLDGDTCAGCRGRIEETPLGDASYTSEMVPHLSSVRAGFNPGLYGGSICGGLPGRETDRNRLSYGRAHESTVERETYIFKDCRRWVETVFKLHATIATYDTRQQAKRYELVVCGLVDMNGDPGGAFDSSAHARACSV